MDSTPVQPRVSDARNGCGKRKCDAQPALLAASCHIVCNGYVCVADSYTLHTKNAGWSQHRYNLVSVMQEMAAVSVNAVRSLHSLLHPATLFVMAMCV